MWTELGLNPQWRDDKRFRVLKISSLTTRPQGAIEVSLLVFAFQPQTIILFFIQEEMFHYFNQKQIITCTDPNKILKYQSSGSESRQLCVSGGFIGPREVIHKSCSFFYYVYFMISGSEDSHHPKCLPKCEQLGTQWMPSDFSVPKTVSWNNTDKDTRL